MAPETDKKCTRPGCTRTLRRHNAKGVCSDRKVCGGTAEATETAKPKPPTVPKPEQAQEVHGVALAQFHVVARALGFNAEEILDQLATSWMESLGEQLRGAAQ